MEGKMVKRLVVLLMIFGLVFIPVSVVVGSNEPKPLSLCEYEDCYGFFAGSKGCSGTTIASRLYLVPEDVGVNELRYSSDCHSFWARSRLSENGYYLASTIDGPPPGVDFSQASSYPLSSGQQVYTVMLTSAAYTRSCGNVSSNSQISIPTYSWCTYSHIRN
jgi:hypothetical protein